MNLFASYASFSFLTASTWFSCRLFYCRSGSESCILLYNMFYVFSNREQLCEYQHSIAALTLLSFSVGSTFKWR
ncbi:hypothetical protein Taro_038029 [Colocasia esculenta]|uniref:Uncharacterized protein n=1 Tax=Colocasia esculenta TaxID=4460 RepID=A0A843W5M0_COLES|nr:hypothetical protein [Colocasia esculenta]